MSDARWVRTMLGWRCSGCDRVVRVGYPSRTRARPPAPPPPCEHTERDDMTAQPPIDERGA